MDKAAIYVPTALISGVGVAAAGYYTYKYFRSKSNGDPSISIDGDGMHSSSSESFRSAREYPSDSEYFDAQEERPNITEEDLLYGKMDELMETDESGIELAYSEMKKYFEEMSEHTNFLWRYAKVHHLMGKVDESNAQKFNEEGMAIIGLKYAEEAMNKDPVNPEAHKWFAILKGKEAEFLKKHSEKADNAKIFFQHIQEALKLRPKDWELHHLLGVFEYKLASLNAFEKIFACQVFKGISTCKYSVAINHFKTAERHNPKSSKETKLFLAKCFYAEQNFTVALKFLKEALEMRIKSIDDKACQKEAEKLKYDYMRMV